MPSLRDLNPTVAPPVGQVEQLKHEVYTLGTPIRQVSSESGLSIDTVKSLLAGNNCERHTAARLEGYLKALARNEFHAVRGLKRLERGHLSGKANKLLRTYYAIQRELWVEYKITSLHQDKFARLTRREQFLELLKKERTAKAALMNKYRPFIDRYRVWLADGWNYWRWRSYLKARILAAGPGG